VLICSKETLELKSYIIIYKFIILLFDYMNEKVNQNIHIKDMYTNWYLSLKVLLCKSLKIFSDDQPYK